MPIVLFAKGKVLGRKGVNRYHALSDSTQGKNPVLRGGEMAPTLTAWLKMEPKQ